MTVVLVLTGLSLGVLARTLSALQSGRRNQDRVAARALAETGLAQALYEMNNLPADIPYPDPGPGPGWPDLDTVHTSVPCTSVSCFKWRAAQDPNAYPANFDQPPSPNAYTVKSEGTVNGVTRTLSESVFRWPLALFADQGIRLDGAPDPQGNFPSRLIGDPTIYQSGVFIGSNRSIVMTNTPDGGNQQNLFGPLASCSGCPRPINEPGPYAMLGNQYATTPLAVPAGPTDCPLSPATWPSIPPGPHVCTGDLNLTGPLTITQPTVIYMTAGHILHLGALAMTTNPDDDPTLLVIHMLGVATIDPGSGFSFDGVLDAPKVDLSCPAGGPITVKGALKLSLFTCTDPTPGTSLHLDYDPRVGQAMGYPWEVSGFHEIPTPTSL